MFVGSIVGLVVFINVDVYSRSLDLQWLWLYTCLLDLKCLCLYSLVVGDIH